MTASQVIFYDHRRRSCSEMLARLALFEKGVSFERRTVDIMEKAEPSEPWYTRDVC